jgi:hypothetical protein
LSIIPAKCVESVPFKRMKIEEKIGNQLSKFVFGKLIKQNSQVNEFFFVYIFKLLMLLSHDMIDDDTAASHK